MRIVVIDQLEEFDRIRTEWEEAYAADKSAHVFVSWPWLRAWFEITPYRWLVLAARPDDDAAFVAFLPLATSVTRWGRIGLVRELHLGGKPLADYTGLVSVPECESRAVAAFARYVQDQLAWDRFRLAEVLDGRLGSLPARFTGNALRVGEGRSLPCPCLPLLPTWEEHLQQSMSGKSRYDLRRAFRNVERLPRFRLSEPVDNDLEEHLDALIMLWEARWGPGEVRDTYRHVFGRAFDCGMLWLRVLWSGEQPIAALSAFADQDRGTIYQHIIAFDREFARQSPGRALVGYSVRSAIEKGYRAYDFLLGGEEYKYSFGAKERATRSATVVRTSVRGTAGRALLRLRRALTAGPK